MYRERIVQTNEYARLKAAIATPGAAALFGLPAVGRAMVYAALALENHRQLAVVTSGEAEATRMAADLSTLGLRAAVLPGRDLVLRPIEGAGRETEYRRLRVLGELVGGRLDAVCLSVESLLLSTVPKEEFCQSTLTLKPGMEIGQQALLEALFRAGYNRRPQVDGPGQFSVRGGILDLYAPDMAAPARIEFWGDEIDTIHSFDLVSQRRDAALEKHGRLPFQPRHEFRHVFLRVKAETVHARVQFHMDGKMRDSFFLCRMHQRVQQAEAIDFRFQVVLEKSLETPHLGIHNHDVGRDARPAQVHAFVGHSHGQVVHALILQRLGDFHRPRAVGRSLHHAHHLRPRLHETAVIIQVVHHGVEIDLQSRFVHLQHQLFC